MLTARAWWFLFWVGLFALQGVLWLAFYAKVVAMRSPPSLNKSYHHMPGNDNTPAKPGCLEKPGEILPAGIEPATTGL